MRSFAGRVMLSCGLVFVSLSADSAPLREDLLKKGSIVVETSDGFVFSSSADISNIYGGSLVKSGGGAATRGEGCIGLMVSDSLQMGAVLGSVGKRYEVSVPGEPTQAWSFAMTKTAFRICAISPLKDRNAAFSLTLDVGEFSLRGDFRGKATGGSAEVGVHWYWNIFAAGLRLGYQFARTTSLGRVVSVGGPGSGALYDTAVVPVTTVSGKPAFVDLSGAMLGVELKMFLRTSLSQI